VAPFEWQDTGEAVTTNGQAAEPRDADLLLDRDFQSMTNAQLKNLIMAIKAKYKVLAPLSGTKKDLVASVALAIAKAKQANALGNDEEVDIDIIHEDEDEPLE
jgi:hypothetical protein